MLVIGLQYDACSRAIGLAYCALCGARTFDTYLACRALLAAATAVIVTLLCVDTATIATGEVFLAIACTFGAGFVRITDLFAGAAMGCIGLQVDACSRTIRLSLGANCCA